MYRFKKANDALTDAVESFYTYDKYDLDQQSDYYVDLVVMNNTIASTNKFIKTKIDDIDVYEIVFFANNVVIPFDKIIHTNPRLYGYKLGSSYREEIKEYYYKKSENYGENHKYYPGIDMGEIKICYHDIPIDNGINMGTEYMMSKGYGNCHNVLRYSDGIAVLGFQDFTIVQ